MSMHDYMPGTWCDKCKSSSPPDDPCKCGACANCGMPLSPDECHCCDECAAFYEMTDPNHRMEDEDGNSHQAAEEA